MASDEVLSAASVREYFIKNGGKVKRDDLFGHFRGHLDKSDDQGTSNNRFGDIINSLASVQNIEGEKYFVLKKATPVTLRRHVRQVNQRKDKGVSLPASMRSFRFSAAEDAFGKLALPNGKSRASFSVRSRAGFRSESHDVGMRRNNADIEHAQANDSGVDTAVSSLQSESPGGSRQSSFSKNSEYDQMSQNSSDTGIFNGDDYYEYDSPSHVLSPFEKSWMMSAMTGNKSEIICQMEEDPSIVNFRDFLMGYTALHWAVKHGDEDLVRLLARGGTDVDAKSNGGFTPLHLASMSGKVNIINILIDECHANFHIRDHSGRKAKDVVKKGSSQKIKLKLTEPKAAIDSSNVGGLSKYMDPKDSPKLKPKLKGAASFRFLKKPKKFKKSDRPVIEHWDSSRQERLESTLESGEKDLQRMVRSNSGSLFPTMFYSSKREESEKRRDNINDGSGEVDGELDTNSISNETRQRLSSRSYPENEFRNLSRISESDVQEPGGDNLRPSMVNRATSEGDAVFGSDSIKQRSFSEDNINQRLQDERVDRSTVDMTEIPPSASAGNPATFAEEVIEREDEEPLRLKIDSDSEMERVDPVRSEEANLKTVSDKGPDEDTLQYDETLNEPRKLNGNIPGFRDDGQRTTDDLEERPTQSFLNAQGETQPGEKYEEQQAIQEDEKVAANSGYQNGEVVPKFNNNYKQVSEILTSEEQQFAESLEEPSPVRPPRKKDKKLKKSPRIEENERNAFSFEAGQPSISTSYVGDRGFDGKREFDTATEVSQPDHWNPNDYVDTRSGMKDGDVYVEPTQSSSSPKKYRLQFDNTNSDYRGKKYNVRVEQRADMKHDFTRDSRKGEHTRRKSDGFPIHRAHSEENVLVSKLKTRRKSEGFRASLEDFTDHRRSERFSRQKGMSLDHLRKSSTDDFRDKQRSEEFPRQKELSLDHLRRSSTDDYTDQQRSEGFSRQKEVSLDHPRKSSTDDHTDQRRLDGLSKQNEMSLDHLRRSSTEDFRDKQRSEGLSRQKEVSLDHPRKEVSLDYPRKEVSLDHPRKEVSLDHPRKEVSLDHPRKEVSLDYPRKEVSLDHPRRSSAEDFRDKQRSEGFSRQKEVSLDHPRRGSKEDVLKIDQEFTRRKSEDLRDQGRSNEMQALKYSRPKSEGFTDQRYESFRDEQRSGNVANQRRSEGFTSQADESLDQLRRRTIHSLPSKTNQSEGRHVLPEVLLDNTRRRNSSGYQMRPQDDREPTRDDLDGNPQIDRRVPPPYRAPPGLMKSPSEGGSYPEQGKDRPSSRPNYMAPPPPVFKDSGSVPNRKSTTEFSDYLSKNLSKNTNLLSQPDYPSSLEVSTKAPPRKHRNTPPSEVHPPTEVSPTAPPRKHRTSLRRSSSESDYHHHPPEVSPVAPPRKRRNSLTRALEGTPTAPPPLPSNTLPLPSNTLPLPSNAPPPPSNAPPPHPSALEGEEYILLAQTVQPPLSVSSNAPSHSTHSREGEDYTYTQITATGYPAFAMQTNTPPSYSQSQSRERDFRREVPPDQHHLPQNSELNEPVIVATRSFEPSQYNSQQQSSNYRLSKGNEYNKSELDNFGDYSRNYQRSGDDVPYRSEYDYNSQQQSSNYRRSAGNEYNKPEVAEYTSYNRRSEGSERYPSEFAYTQPQSSDYQRSVGNDYYPSEYNKRKEQSSVYRQSESNEYSQFIPSFETTAARGQVATDEKNSFRRSTTVDVTTADQSPPDEVVLARSVPLQPEHYTNYSDEEHDAPDYIPTRNQPESRGSGYTMDKRNGMFDHPRFNSEFESVSVPKYDGYSETGPVSWPKFHDYKDTSTVRPEVNISRSEQDFTEPEFIVAKQMPSRDERYEPRMRGSREDMDTLPEPLGQEMKNKWVSNSSDGSNESGENKKYRMTSII
ncbi:ankyrin repeat domain-containing protein 11-like isoform X2 [Dendronephthya gigantea]|uniref:ankyrin repeat domain-containing protein 11-like isoform X2 n=1 Tax=Dendronephthya gigantea TaxID=151771 RepID=UPI0010695320|nr:ankyrin repeat domain-containing protein 11-like isoform X2 [Dendronephthya gigantea]